MFYKLAAEKEGWLLSVSTCMAFGLQPMIDISKTHIKKMGGLKALKKEAELQAQASNRPVALVDFEGNRMFQSSNWPKPGAGPNHPAPNKRRAKC